MGEEKAEAIKTHVKVDLDVKDQEDLAKTDAKTQVNLCCASFSMQKLVTRVRTSTVPVN